MDKNLSSLITIFGGTGDLSYRKLLPSIFNLYKKGHFKKLVIISTGLEDISGEEYRSKVKQILLSRENFEMVNLFLDNIFYFQQNVEDKTSWNKLKELSNDIDKKYCLDGNRLFYLAMNPQFFKIITQSISQSGLSDTNGFSRLIIEKPFGKDLKSAEDLNKHIRQYFKEEEIFRIDHYLGKEMVQNIESLRFGNTIFEPLWNNKYISNVQITLSETLGIEDRGQYYDSTGALKDMVQNHALQILTLIAMEKPESRNSKDIRLKKIELLNNIKFLKGADVHKYFVRGQYINGIINETPIMSYHEEKGVDSDSTTETFVAGKVLINNRRWEGTPFYIRTGKRLGKKATEIVIEFKKNNNTLRYENNNEDTDCNLLVINIEPNAKISLYIYENKSNRNNRSHNMKIYNSIDKNQVVDAYESLICDALIGNQTNFVHWEELKQSWEFIDYISTEWKKSNVTIPQYKPGSFGPKESDQLLKQDNFEWWNNL
ncbi:TPA: glucose-6-phosphate dehydrogenase [Staphylococcus aureus]|nr:glucose-6-phosphate dehydrogenase [Staphylococcus aureus]